MSISRNAPCPCGSGKKYKQCCLDADTERARSLRLVQGAEPGVGASAPELGVSPEVLQAFDRDDIWELDAVPVPVALDDERVGRFCVRLLVIGDYVIGIQPDAAPPSEPEDVAEMLLAWMRETVDGIHARHGVTLQAPDTLRVRHPSVAQAMQRLIDGPTRVVASALLPELDRAANGLRKQLGNEDAVEGESDSREGIILLSMPLEWSAWGMADDARTALFDAAARFWRASPWTRLDDTELVSFTATDRPTNSWHACVLGASGEQFGVVLYEDETDFLRIFETDDPDDLMRGLQGAVISLYFDPRSALPRPMQQEFRRHKWTVADNAAHPILSVANTPAGGVTRVQTAMLTRTLDALANLVATDSGLPPTNEPLDVEWHRDDAAAGLHVSYRGTRAPDRVRLWSVPEQLSAGCATGPAASAAALFPRDLESEEALDARLATELERVDRFLAWLDARGGERVRARADQTLRTHASNAQLFIEHLAFGHGVTVAALHEAHLRVFLYSWYPSHAPKARAEVGALVATLRLFFSWLESEGIVCAWAAGILDERAALDARIASAPTEDDPGKSALWWHYQLDHDLYARVMLADPLLVEEDDEPAADPGERELMLADELLALTLTWREESIADGVTEPAVVRARCARQQAAWETSLHPTFSKSPTAVIRQERRRLERELPS